MLVAVVDHMAPLAERREISRVIVGGIMIEMGAGQHHTCAAQPIVQKLRRWQLSSGRPHRLRQVLQSAIPPAPIAEV